MWKARPIWWRLFWHLVRDAASRTFWTAGTSRPIRTAIMAMTTSSSISVKPRRARMVLASSPGSNGTTLQLAATIVRGGGQTRGEAGRGKERPCPPWERGDKEARSLDFGGQRALRPRLPVTARLGRSEGGDDCPAMTP